MSTYYCFKCPCCNEVGGFFSRQAWGYGNAEIVETFKFIFLHLSECCCPYLEIISEHDDDFAKDRQIDFFEITKDMFPCSNDWAYFGSEEHAGNRSFEESMKEWEDHLKNPYKWNDNNGI